ncbi:MAG: cyclic pyranopterin monophosphate synthase MoaC, partial [Deltaproteobacteria bacterium]|nr:cyclic pyranopterin monophosphate synthase MoaC [Deltaproteobacteria bacterium]
QTRAIAKGDVLGVARIAGIMATKRTADLVPLCHPLNLTGVELKFRPRPKESAIDIEARVKTDGKTGVEMEAFVAVATAAITIYDMCKAVDRAMVISNIHLVEKRGGKSGTYLNPNRP